MKTLMVAVLVVLVAFVGLGVEFPDTETNQNYKGGGSLTIDGETGQSVIYTTKTLCQVLNQAPMVGPGGVRGLMGVHVVGEPKPVPIRHAAVLAIAPNGDEHCRILMSSTLVVHHRVGNSVQAVELTAKELR